MTKEISCFETFLSITNDRVQDKTEQKQEILTFNCMRFGVKSTDVEYAVLNIATLIMNALLSPEFYTVLIPEACAIYIE